MRRSRPSSSRTKRAVQRDELEPFTWALHDKFVARGSLDDVRNVLADAARAHLATIRGFDAVLTPVVATPPWPLGHLSPLVPADELIRRTAAIVAYTPVHNVAGARRCRCRSARAVKDYRSAFNCRPRRAMTRCCSHSRTSSKRSRRGLIESRSYRRCVRSASTPD